MSSDTRRGSLFVTREDDYRKAWFRVYISKVSRERRWWDVMIVSTAGDIERFQSPHDLPLMARAPNLVVSQALP